MDENEKFVFNLALEKWGVDCQMAAAIEEFSELNVELAKLLNGKRDACNEEDLALLLDELADAVIMLRQLISMYELDQKIHDRISYKMDKLRKRLMDDF